jgi:hypothetical protein
MTDRFRKDQRVYCPAEKQYGKTTSGPRNRTADFRPGLTPPFDPKAIPSYDVLFENGKPDTIPETELESVPGHRYVSFRGWLRKNRTVVAVVLGLPTAIAGVVSLYRLFGSPQPHASLPSLPSSAPSVQQPAHQGGANAGP